MAKPKAPQQTNTCENCKAWNPLMTAGRIHGGECRLQPKQYIPELDAWSYPPHEAGEWCAQHIVRANS
jgi:hypothetical protein